MYERIYIPDEEGEACSYDEKFVPDYPIHLDIEASSRCNLNCTFCDKQPLLKADSLGDIDIDLFRKIVIESSMSGCESIGLSYRGEPLLNKNIVEMVKTSKDAGIKWVSFCTNGMLLTPYLAESLINAGLDEITVSAQGADAKSFEYKRLGSNFDLVCRNVEYLISLKNKLKEKTPFIRIQAVDLDDFDKDSFFEFWKDRSDKIVIVPYEEAVDRKNISETNWVCPQPYKRLTVEWDGTILPCNNDDIKKYKLGNAQNMTIKEAWNSDIMKMLRKMHREGKYSEIEDCSQCPFSYSAAVKKNNYICEIT